MMRYSYKVEVKRLELKISSLKFNLLKNPNNQRASLLLKEAEQEMEWFNQKIKEGKDPGVIII